MLSDFEKERKMAEKCEYCYFETEDLIDQQGVKLCKICHATDMPVKSEDMNDLDGIYRNLSRDMCYFTNCILSELREIKEKL